MPPAAFATGAWTGSGRPAFCAVADIANSQISILTP